ncbi:MAG: YhbY family RNA-binding protein [Zoogloea sp.]|nr:YhbY family RNA-binding protein [Zoogloea sp.]
MIELTPTRRRELRAEAHRLNPVVSVAGNGLTPAVLNEIERSLQAHELIKVRVYGHDHLQRDTLMTELCNTLEAASVQHIGNILVIWRERREEADAAAVPAEKAKRNIATAKSAKALSARRGVQPNAVKLLGRSAAPRRATVARAGAERGTVPRTGMGSRQKPAYRKP